MPVERRKDTSKPVEMTPAVIVPFDEVKQRQDQINATNANTAAVEKLTLELQNYWTRMAIDRRTPEPAKSPPPAGKGQTCNDWIKDGVLRKKGCGAPIRWGKIDGKSRMLNEDGAPHHCGGLQQ